MLCFWSGQNFGPGWFRFDSWESAAVPQGKIKKVVSDRGFGFIDSDRGDLFFHHSEVKEGSFDHLQEGDLVEFEVGSGKKGPCATSVRPVK
jgi:cold shock protein